MTHPAQSPARRPVILLSAATLLLGLALAIAARGLAGDEELSHYLIARTAPIRPELFLSLVGRPLVTLLLALGAPGGALTARLVAVVATLLTVLATARLIPRCSGLPGWTALPLLFLQPFFIAHSATAMAEPFAAAAVAWGLVALVEKRPGMLAILSAVAVTIRFELAAFWPLVTLWLVRSGRGRWAFCLPLPLLLWGLVAGIVHRDLLWLVRQTAWGTYPTREAFHYVKTFGWIVGPGLLFPVLAGLALVAATTFKLPRGPGAVGPRRRVKSARRSASHSTVVRSRAQPEVDHAMVLRFASIFLLGCILIYSALAWWRPVTYGNLRYLAVCAAPLALLAAGGFEVMERARERRILIGLLALVVLIALLWSHPLHQDFLILTTRTYYPLIAAVAVLALALARPRLALGRAGVALAVGCAGLALDYRTTLHWVDVPEAAAVVRVAGLLSGDSGPVLGAHPRLAAELGLNPYLSSTWPLIPSTIRGAAEPGTRLYWDSHYLSVRGPDFTADAFVKDPAWDFLGAVTSSDSTFTGAVFKKRPAPREGAVPPEAEAWAACTRRVLSGVPRSRAILAIDPRNPGMWRTLGFQLLITEDLAGARRALVKAEELDPGVPENALLEARIDQRMGRNDAALAALLRGLQKKPNDGDLNLQMGRLLAMMHRPGEATPYLDRAAEEMKQRWDVQYMIGSYYLSQRDLSRAAERFDLATRLNPRMVEPYLAAATALRQMGRNRDAEGILRTLIRRQPGSTQGYSMLGELLSAQGRTAEARQVWQEGADRTGDPALRQRLAAP